MITTPKSNVIEKENIHQLAFGSTDVLMDEQLKIQRKRRLKRAEQLGNSYKTKSKILFTGYVPSASVIQITSPNEFFMPVFNAAP